MRLLRWYWAQADLARRDLAASGKGFVAGHLVVLGAVGALVGLLVGLPTPRAADDAGAGFAMGGLVALVLSTVALVVAQLVSGRRDH
jgi:hypothetical protein